MRDLLLAVPSRGRPQNIARLLDSLRGTCQAETSVAVGLDEDDPERALYPGCRYPEKHGLPGDFTYYVRDDLRKVTAWTNYLVDQNLDGYRAFGQVGDDNVFATPGWDKQILAALDKTPFAFGNDQYPSREPGTLSCHVFMRADVVKKLGYFGPPEIAHMYVDVAWYAWGQACGITYLHDVLIPHLHYTTGAAPGDATYQASYAGTGTDLQAWHAYCRSGRLNDDIRKLGGTEYTPQAVADFNSRLFIPETW